MAEYEFLNDEAVEAVTGGINTTDWTRAHWQPTNIPMGSTFVQNGHTWYRIKSGDSLSRIAKKFGTTAQQLKVRNPNTIADINTIFAGDAIIVL